MEQVILGLMVLQSMTIYELHSVFKRGVSLFYSASYGSLQSALKKLVAREAVTFQEVMEGKRRKKIYTITEAGGKEFYQWMRKPIPKRKMTSTILAKLYFLGLIKRKSDKRKIIVGFIEALRESEQTLVNADRQVSEFVSPPELKDLFSYQYKTLQFGLHSSRFTIAWFEELLRELDNYEKPRKSGSLQ